MKAIAKIALIALLLCALTVAGASAQLSAEADGEWFYIGKGNRVYNARSASALSADAAAAIVRVDSDHATAYFAAANGEALTLVSCPLDDWTDVTELEELACLPVYSEKDDAIYYACEDEPETLCALIPFTGASRALCVADAPIIGLRLSASGLLVRTENGEKQYFSASRRLRRPIRDTAGSELILFEDGSQAMLSEEGALTLKAADQAGVVSVADPVAAIAGCGDTLYYLSVLGRRTALYALDVSDSESEPYELHWFSEALMPCVAADGNAVYVVGQSTVLYRYRLVDDAVDPMKVLGAGVKSPVIRTAGSLVLAYDAAREADKTFVASADVRSIRKITPSPTPRPTVRPTVTPRPTPKRETEDDFTALSTGSRGDAVERLQRALIDLGYLTGSADGYYGEATVRAVKLLQGDMGDNETGRASAAFQYTVFHGNPPTYVQYVTLRSGDSGIRVREMQERLRELYYMKEPANGNFWNATAEAVKAFQAEAGFNTASRITATQLKRLFARSAPEYSEYIELERGDEAPAVKRLARRLKKLNYLTGSVTEAFNRRLYDAVFLFQGYNGLLADGIATSELQSNMIFDANARVYQPEPTPTPEPTPAQVVTNKQVKTMKEWMNKHLKKSYGKEEAVKRLQKKLIAKGYLGSGKTTKVYDQDTFDAVSAYQSSVGLGADGVADKETLQMLFDK